MSQFDETFDFIVVGCGAGSMPAAMVMRDAGKSVVVLEKSDSVGGTTAKSGGVMWIPNNPFMARDGVQDSYEQAEQYLNSLIAGHENVPGSTPERRAAYLKHSPELVHFLLAHGVKLTRVPYWPDYYDDLPGGCEPGRTVVAELFDTKQLGARRKQLQRGFLPLPLMLGDALRLGYLGKEWSVRWAVVKFVGRLIAQLFTGKRRVSAGAALQGWMIKAGLDHGVELRTDAAVSQLLVDSGRVTGVEVVIDGQPRRLGASLGVLVNAGGFAHSAELRAQYLPATQASWTNTIPSDTGDLIPQLGELGAQFANMDTLLGYQSAVPPGHENDYVKPGMQKTTVAPHCILVDQSGVRYMNEGGSYVAYCRNMLERNKTVPAVPSWAVMDHQGFKSVGVTGKKSLRQVKPWLESGFLKMADSLADLAIQMDCDPDVLQATVARFNGFARQGKDEDFNRGGRAYDRWLGNKYNPSGANFGELSQGPFFAFPVIPGDVSTYGGAVTDEHARVLNQDGNPIPGLYATGTSAASVFGHFYPGAGASIGPSATFGYLAARHAVANS